MITGQCGCVKVLGTLNYEIKTLKFQYRTWHNFFTKQTAKAHCKQFNDFRRHVDFKYIAI